MVRLLYFVLVVLSLGQAKADNLAQETALTKIIEGACSQDDEACKAFGRDFSKSLINDDSNMFEKNKAGLILAMCSRRENYTEKNICYYWAGRAAGDPITNILETADRALSYKWIWSTKTRRFLFTTDPNGFPVKWVEITKGIHGPSQPFENTGSGWAFTKKFVQYYERILAEFADPSKPLPDSLGLLKRNGIDPEDAKRYCQIRGADLCRF